MVSSEELNREIAFAGQRVKQKVIVALALVSVIPLLLLTYALQTPVRSLLGPIGELGDTFTVPAMLLFATLLMAGGGFVVWDIASAISHTGSDPASARWLTAAAASCPGPWAARATAVSGRSSERHAGSWARKLNTSTSPWPDSTRSHETRPYLFVRK